MTLKEIEAKKAELRNKINDAKSEEELEELRKQVEELNKEVPSEEKEIIHEEERRLIADTESLEQRKVEIVGTLAKREERKMKEFTKFNVLKSEEYRSAWAKRLMCKDESEFTEDEKRALGVALTTTATTYTAPSAGADGVNNGGLFIPDTVSMEILKDVELESPFLRDIAKTYVKGLITFPYKKQGSGAEWVVEGTDNSLETDEWATLTFTQMELSKTIRITWKLEAMTVEDFINYIVEEVAREMRESLAAKPFYGNGTNEIAGITLTGNNIDAEYESTVNPLDAIKAAIEKLPIRRKAGAKIYLSESMATEIAFMKDTNGTYLNNPVNGVALNSIARYSVEVDPYLKDGDFIIGNARWYKMNFNENLSVSKDVIGRSRVNDYTGYCVVGGAPVPNSFVYGHKASEETV